MSNPEPPPLVSVPCGDNFVFLDPELYAALEELSERTGAPIAHYLREGVKKVLMEHWVTLAKPRRER
jgi:hypothetical protein